MVSRLYRRGAPDVQPRRRRRRAHPARSDAVAPVVMQTVALTALVVPKEYAVIGLADGAAPEHPRVMHTKPGLCTAHDPIDAACTVCGVEA